MTKLVDNEQTKYLAAALDRASTACFTVGVATPVIGYFFDINRMRSAVGWEWFIAIVTISTVAGILLHLGGRRTLGGLDE